MINQQVAGHARHPRCESSVCRAVTHQCPIHAKEHILRQILGLRAVPYESVADVVDTPRVPTHKFLPGRAIALEALLDQLGILLQASLAPFSRFLHSQLPQVTSLSLP